MIYIAFAASPNQLINIKEYIYKNKINNYIIYIFLSSNINVNKELLRSVRILKLKKIIKIKKSKNQILNLTKNIFLIINLYFNNRNKKKIFIISDFLNSFYHILRSFFKDSKFILVDDGNATFWIYKKYFSKNIYLPINQKKGFFKKRNIMINLFINYDFLKKTKFEFFTTYTDELGLNKKYLNNLDFCKSLRKKKYKFDKNSVFIIGTKYFESNILSLNEEIEILKKIINFWKNKDVTYVAKRTTSVEKILKIKKQLNINVVYYGLPLEIALIRSNNKLPLHICSMGSGLDMIVPMLFSDINYYSINFRMLKKNPFFIQNSKFFNQFFKIHHDKIKILNL